MATVGHFVVTYARSSWLVNQLHSIKRYQNKIYSWTRNVDDDITESPNYVQVMSHLGTSRLRRKIVLGAALLSERLLRIPTTKLSRKMKRDRVDVIHSHFGRAGYYALPMRKRVNVPLVTSFYGYDVAQYGRYRKWQEYYKRLFADGDLMLCLGKSMVNDLVTLGCPIEKTRIQHLGVDISAIEYLPRQWDGSEPLKVLIAAAFRPKKGIPYALEALGRIQHDIPLTITVIGDAVDTPDGQAEKQQILATIDKYGLRDKTILLGFKPYSELVQQAYSHHIFLSPSLTADDGDMEGTPMVLADMAATGIPIISTQHADIPELVVDGVTGLLAQERDIDGLVTHLQWLAANRERWEIMTQAGRKHIETEFNLDTQADKLQAIYDEVIAYH